MLFTGPNQKNLEKYGKNQVHKAWVESDTVVYSNGVEGIDEYSTEFTTYLCKGKPKFIYDGRFCAVSGFIFAIVNGKYSVLANKRGSGTPDYQGYWNCPCGYLERYENSKEGIAREMLEECGFQIDLDDLNVITTETDPAQSNHGNVTIRHGAFLGKIIPHYIMNNDGEENEVDDVRWIPIDDIDKYNWAFNHYEIIKKYAPCKADRKLMEFFYKWFRGYNKTYTSFNL